MTVPHPPRPVSLEPAKPLRCVRCVRCGADLAANGIVAYLEQPNGDTVCSEDCR